MKIGEYSTFSYDKLVTATGSTPKIPNLDGIHLTGVFNLTQLDEANAIRNYIQNGMRKALVVGAGLIGLETAEAFANQGLDVTVVEALNWVLPEMLDFEAASYLAEHLREKGVTLLCGQSVGGFLGDADGKVCKALVGGKELDTDIVLLSIGNTPNSSLARDTGIEIGALGGIKVNSRMETSAADIYAGGDCVENVNIITGKGVLAPLGSTANKHGRVIGTNITGGSDTFPGVLQTACVKVFDYNVGRTGLTERRAINEGYDVITSLVPAPDHANYYPGSEEIMVKLVAEKASGRLLGAQIVGPGEAVKRADVMATALSFGATIDDLAGLDLSYAPPYNSAFDPLHYAANVIRNKRDGLAVAITPAELQDKLERDEDFILLDVRAPEEWHKNHIEARQTVQIPLPELRQKLDTLPKDAEIVILCRTSVRAYLAHRILKGAGFSDTKFLDASINGWPYPLYGTRSRKHIANQSDV